MRVQFSAPVVINHVRYAKGIQEIPDDLKAHWFLRGLVDAKKAVIVESAKPSLSIHDDMSGPNSTTPPSSKDKTGVALEKAKAKARLEDNARLEMAKIEAEAVLGTKKPEPETKKPAPQAAQKIQGK